MSYILDALRRADSDRERGAIPSLHTNASSAGPIDAEDADGSARSVQPLWWAVGALSVALLGMAGWMVFGRSVPPAEPVVAAAPAPVPVAPPPVAVPAPAPVSPPPVVMAEPAERVAPPPAVAPAPARAVVAKPAKPATKPATAAPVAEDTPVPSISELPDDVRRQLPALSVSGASYSKNAASRMLILNGQVFREGDKVANDVVLEQIRLKSAVLSYRGQRYSINF